MSPRPKIAAAPPALSRARVCREALALVDAEGLEALSMRRLGARLGVEAMSLYRHVRDKADLIDALYAAVLGDLMPEHEGLAAPVRDEPPAAAVPDAPAAPAPPAAPDPAAAFPVAALLEVPTWLLVCLEFPGTSAMTSASTASTPSDTP